MLELKEQERKMATPAQRAARRRRRQKKVGNGQRNAPSQASAPGIRSFTVRTTYKTGLTATEDEASKIVGVPVQPNANWPEFKGAIGTSLQYRIRSGTATYQSMKQSEDGLLGLLFTHVGNVWKPSSMIDHKSRGGTLKPIRTSGWSTQLPDPGLDWVDTSAPGGMIYCTGTSDSPQTNVGLLTLNLTVQVRGVS